MTRPLHSTPSGRLDPWLLLGDAQLRRVLDILNPPGEETRLVGGAVRNALLGLSPGDIDLATTMVPNEVTRLAKAAKLRVIPTGIAHGTVTVMSAKHPFEVTTLREDVETDGRHAVVRFGRDFARDAERRDFTMNALSLGPDGTIFDTVGGLADLAEGRVRFIGDAPTRIREDYLRILRFFRFHATYGIGDLDAVGLDAAGRLRDGLATLSRERVRAEFFKILMAPGVIAVLHAVQSAGLLPLILPGRADVDRLSRVLVLEPTADATLRLAAVSADLAATLDPLRDGLRLTNAEMKRLAALCRASADLATVPSPPDDTTLLRLLFDHGREAAIGAMRLASADHGAKRGIEALSFLSQAAVPCFPFDSADLMRRGLKGPALGAALALLRRLWAEAGFPVEASDLEALLALALSSRLA